MKHKLFRLFSGLFLALALSFSGFSSALAVGSISKLNLQVPQSEIFVWVMDTGTQIGGFNLAKMTPDGSELWRTQFGQSLAIGVDPRDGSVWAPERNDNQGNSDQVVKLDANGSLVRRVQGYQTEIIAVDPRDGSVWVGLPNLVKLDSDGVALLNVPGFDAPASIAVDPRDSSVWVADGGGVNGRKLVKLNSNGQELFRIGTPGFFSDAPQQIAVDPRDGSVWYTGSSTGQVFKISTDGGALQQVGGFDLPSSVTVDPIDGSVWVADFSVTTSGAMVKLDSNGNELLRVSLGTPPRVASVHPEDGSVWVGIEGALVKLSTTGQVIQTLSTFTLPKAIVIAKIQPVLPWYVSTTGNDANDCMSPTTPCATINGAIGKASTGDTINVAVGIYTGTGSEVVLIDKDATLSGGWDETFTTQSGNSTIDGQMARGGMTVFGIATVENFAIQNGLAGSGAGIWNAGNTTINNSAISSNTATGYIGNYSGGGGIYNTGTVNLNDSTLTMNIGFGITNEGTLTVNNSTISDNQGYGIAVLYGSIATINSSTVSNNTSDGVFNRFNLTIDRSHISNNLGWGVQNWNGGNSTINNSTFSGNKTGGILQYSGGSLTLDNSSVSNNPGKGIQNWYGGSLILNNSTVSGNKGGGIFQVSGGSLVLNSSTVSNNTYHTGGGIYADSGTVTLQNTIVAGNTADTGDCWSPISGIYISAGYNIIGNISGCGFPNTTGDLTNIDAKLGFLIGSPGYHPLASDSPAVDAGNPIGCEGNSGLLTTDQRGVTRVGNCDIGAYEYTTPGSAVSLSSVNGSDERGAINSAFPEPLRAAALDSQGSPVSGVTINFVAPTNGASGTFADTGNNTTSANTDALGVASTSTFTANNQAGTYIVSASAIALGSVNINLEQIIPPANDNFSNAEVISSLPFTATADITNAGKEANEPQWCYFMPNTVWYSFTPNETIFMQVDTQGSTISSNVNIYHSTGSGISDLVFQFQECGNLDNPSTFLAEAGQTYYFQAGAAYEEVGTIQVNLQQVFPPANDNFNNAEAITSLPFNTTVNNSNAGVEAGEPQWCYYSPNTVWYSFTPSANALVRADMAGSSFGDTIFNVYQLVGSGFNGLSNMQCAYYGNSATFNVQAGVTYYIQAGSINNSGGDLQFNLQEIPRPANADFANAVAVTSLPFSSTPDVTNGGIEPNEPQYCYYMYDTVWYSFTPTEKTLVRANTQGSAISSNLNVYHDTGSGISGLSLMPSGCTVYYSPVTFIAEAGQTYYFQAGGINGQVGTVQVNLEQLPLPANDDFANATIVTQPLPFDNTVDTQYSTRQTGEPTPSCAYYGPGTRSVWYAYTPATSGSFSASILGYAFTPVFAAYTGSSMGNLTQVGCQTSTGNLMTLHMNAGTTYYFQVGNLYYWEQGGSMQFHLDIAPQPVASFYTNPFDPSKYDTVQFYDGSYDPGNVGFQTFGWTFGDGGTSSVSSPTHKYAADGDYQVTHTVTTIDGRTSTITQTVQVRTHDVAITKITTPASANVGQTKTITVTLRNIAYSETVQIDLYKSTPNGFVWIGSVTKSVPALSGNRTTAVNFSYTFTSDDARLGKVTFKAVATIVGARDAYPADNEVISLITKVAR